jgi:hypothetical protein
MNCRHDAPSVDFKASLEREEVIAVKIKVKKVEQIKATTLYHD